jgi:hypothetical protein
MLFCLKKYRIFWGLDNIVYIRRDICAKSSYLIDYKTDLVHMILKILLYFRYIHLFVLGGAKRGSLMDIQQLESQSEKADSDLELPHIPSQISLSTPLLRSNGIHAIRLRQLLLPLPFRQRKLYALII